MSAQCADGHEGALCAVCMTDWYRNDARSMCMPCEETDSTQIMIIFASVVVVGIVLLLVVLRCVQRLRSGPGDGRVARAVGFFSRSSASLGIKLRILVSLSQLIKGTGFVFNIRFPPLFKDLTTWLGNILQVDLPNLVPIACIQKLSFIDLLVLRTASPIVAALGFTAISTALGATSGAAATKLDTVAIAKAAKKPVASLFKFAAKQASASTSIGSKPSQESFTAFLSSAASNAAFIIMYLVFPMASVAVIQFFVCDDIDAGDGQMLSLLRVDTSIDCNSQQWLTWRAYAIGMLFVYPIGVPAYFALLLVRHRHVLKRFYSLKSSKEDEGDNLERTPQLPQSVLRITAGYSPQCYWFELFEAFRKLVIVGLPCTFATGSFEQLFFGVLTCFLTWGALLLLR